MSWFNASQSNSPGDSSAGRRPLDLRVREEAVILREQSLDERERQLQEQAAQLNRELQSLAAREHAMEHPEAAVARAVAQKEQELQARAEKLMLEQRRLSRLEQRLNSREAELTAYEQMHSFQVEQAAGRCSLEHGVGAMPTVPVPPTSVCSRSGSPPVEKTAAPSRPVYIPSDPGATPLLAPPPRDSALESELAAALTRLADVEGLLAQTRRTVSEQAEAHIEWRIKQYDLEERMTQQEAHLDKLRRRRQRDRERRSAVGENVVNMTERRESVDVSPPRDIRRQG